MSIAQGALTVSNQGASVDLFNGNVSMNAVIGFGTAAQTVTGMTFQLEEWSGVTTDGSTWTVLPQSQAVITATTVSSPLTLMGLRTYRYGRVNALTFAVSTNANVPVFAVILEQPKSEAAVESANSATGYSNWPSSGSTNGT